MTLAEHKKDKMLEGVIDKKRTRFPAHTYNLEFHISRFYQEVREVRNEIDWNKLFIYDDDCSLIENKDMDVNSAMPIPTKEIVMLKRELADVSNFIDFIFERLRQNQVIYTK